ncbi:MAG: M20/M25/M40 family metallo-hydrolase [Bryobacteraceae bacterium]|nr:M20/M25/M40 family metallo-hydrolase [Bryobacteraceae bacterium]
MRSPLALFLCAALVVAAAVSEEKTDLTMVHRIRAEALENSKVMDHLFQLTEVNGPRLTGSPGYRKAAEWVVKQAQSYGLSNAHLEKWGPFGRGWDFRRFSAHLVEPAYAPLVGFPLAWTSGTNGLLTGELTMAVIKTAADFPRHKGKLKGKIVLLDAIRETPVRLEAPGKRHDEASLAALSEGVIQPPRPPVDESRARRFRSERAKFLKDEGVLAAITNGTAGDGGTVFATSGGSQDPKVPVPPPFIVLTPEHYNRVARLLEKKIPVKIEFEVDARIEEGNHDSWNVVAELPGGRKKDEWVMVGAHLDSWHGGTGATDNAAGSAVMLEVMRILKAVGAPMDRSVRLVLWSGEEQGLLGSKAYVKEHFADPAVMKLTSMHGKVSAYFNLDNGTGKIRGVYLQGNDMVRPVFEAWLKPFHDLGAKSLAIRDTRGTDHLSFDAVGIPAFQFIQDPVEYSTRTHHSNMDVYDHASAADLMQASAVIASFVYHAAAREEMLPRKPLPKAKPERGDEEKKAAVSGQ